RAHKDAGTLAMNLGAISKRESPELFLNLLTGVTVTATERTRRTCHSRFALRRRSCARTHSGCGSPRGQRLDSPKTSPFTFLIPTTWSRCRRAAMCWPKHSFLKWTGAQHRNHPSLAEVVAVFSPKRYEPIRRRFRYHQLVLSWLVLHEFG